jgi:hypothetical protein
VKAWREGRVEEAEALFTRGLADTGNDGYLALRYAEFLESAKEPERAREMFELAYKKLPRPDFKESARRGLTRVSRIRSKTHKPTSLTQEEFAKWVNAGHAIFDLFEGRNDAYPLARTWAEEWLQHANFEVNQNQLQRVRALVRSFDPSVFGARPATGEALVDSLSRLVENSLPNPNGNIGFGLAPFLFTWNFQRFKTYVEQGKQIDVSQYFSALGRHLGNFRGELARLKNRGIFDEREPQEDIQELFARVNSCLGSLGVGQNEPVGTAKILHVLAPSLLPLIDNPIARALGLLPTGSSLNFPIYREWILRLKEGLHAFSPTIQELQSQHGLPILKLVDEALYVMCSVTLRHRVASIGL